MILPVVVSYPLKTAKGGAALYLLSLKRDDGLRFGGEAVGSRCPVVRAWN